MSNDNISVDLGRKVTVSYNNGVGVLAITGIVVGVADSTITISRVSPKGLPLAADLVIPRSSIVMVLTWKNQPDRITN